MIEEKTIKSRLYFIDFARSIAIIMMLEGHFTGASLAEKYKNLEYPLFSFWHGLHGLTSPLFFTTSGLIFVYLLTGSQKPVSFMENERVKKGFKRVLQLLFWGYFIQLNVFSLLKSFYYGSAWKPDWFFAFHVLQSIGLSIFLLLIIYGIRQLFKIGRMHWYYLLFAVLILGFYTVIKGHIQSDEKSILAGASPAYWPQHFPSFIQNMFYGKFSDFAIVRYAPYVLLGGMLGSIVRTYEKQSKKLWFGGTFVGVGILLMFFIQPGLRSLDSMIEYLSWTNESTFELACTHLIRFGQVMVLLGILMVLDSRVNINYPRFLKMGQNTLPIYIIHVIILYGGIFGIGLIPNAFDQNLNPYASIAISISTIVTFFIMCQNMESLEKFYFGLWRKLKLKQKDK